MVPVTDQDAALPFYVDDLGREEADDVTYATGERWLEVSSVKGSSHLCLVLARPERPAGIETGIVLLSTDVLADHHGGLRTDDSCPRRSLARSG
jgi:hypothetical protein